MPPSNDTSPTDSAAAWLQALWGQRVRVVETAASVDAPALQRAVLTGRGDGERVLHLPPPPLRSPSAWRRACATAAHAAAHWRFGGPPQARTGLKPVQQAVFDVLEDARVEARARDDMPGLRALWLPFHTGPDAPASASFEALLARLARALLEPQPLDDHPWVQRGCALFHEHEVGAPAGSGPMGLRYAASVLGNDIGQMRLGFTARGYRAHAAYRDDNSWVWLPDSTAPHADVPLAASATAAETKPPTPDLAPTPVIEPTAPAPEADGPPLRYPEWDRRIGRLRPGWCSVYTRDALLADPAAVDRPSLGPGFQRSLGDALRTLRGGVARPVGRGASGDEFHHAALVDARLAHCVGDSPDPRVFRRLQPQPPRLAVQLLVDASASTADPGTDGRPLLAHLLALAVASSQALDHAGHRSAVMAFSSRTRHRVEMRHLKHWHESATDLAVRSRCAGLQPEGSTRFGVALRHAAAAAQTQVERFSSRRALVLLLTDGEPHDVDVHDPRYLPADLRQAVIACARQGVAARCLRVAVGSIVASQQAQRAVAQAFGLAQGAVLRDARHFPLALAGLLRT